MRGSFVFMMAELELPWLPLLSLCWREVRRFLLEDLRLASTLVHSLKGCPILMLFGYESGGGAISKMAESRKCSG